MLRVTVKVLSLIFVGLILFVIYLWNHQAPLAAVDNLPPTCALRIQQMLAQPLLNPDNCEVRQWYLHQVEQLAVLDESLQSFKVDVRARAECAYSVRRAARLVARRMMPSDWEVLGLRFRDWMKYGRPDGPSFDDLMQDKEPAQAFEDIIASARRTRGPSNLQCD